jgi:hypothetical protein
MVDEVDWGPNGQKGFQSWHKNVTPAMQAERTYRLASNVYNEYKALRKQGKDFPTGAQSVQMLSYHMANTFGNVKGARITKDLIEKHMGARSVSDSALVAVQKLTNGEQLSPSQWDAYFSMVGQTAMRPGAACWTMPQSLQPAHRLHRLSARPSPTLGPGAWSRQAAVPTPAAGRRCQQRRMRRPAAAKGHIKLSDARNLPQFKGMTDDQMTRPRPSQWNYTV